MFFTASRLPPPPLFPLPRSPCAAAMAAQQQLLSPERDQAELLLETREAQERMITTIEDHAVQITELQVSWLVVGSLFCV